MPNTNLTKSHVGNYLLSCYSIETVKRRYFSRQLECKDSVSICATYFGADSMIPTGNTLMFTKKTNQSSEPKLEDIARKVSRSGYIFIDINADLAAASDEIVKCPKQVVMAYGYARRAAVAAIYIQGHLKKEDYDYVQSIFVSLQVSTDRSKEFQEQAYADSIAYMQTYHHIINNNFLNTLISTARDYEIPSGHLDDNELIEEVLEIIHQEQESIQTRNKQKIQNTVAKLFDHLTSTVHTNQNKANEHDLHRINEIISMLTELSNLDDQKNVTMWITPLEEKWSCEFHFSEEEVDAVHELTNELYGLLKGKVTMPTFPYRKKIKD